MEMTLREFKNHGSDPASLNYRHRWDWRSIGAFCGLSSGIIAVVIGSLLTAISWMSNTEGGSYVKTIGTILLVLTMPLLICGAHCLDLMEKQKDRERAKRFNEHE